MTGRDRLLDFLRRRREELTYVAVGLALGLVAFRSGWLGGPVGWALIALLGFALFQLIRAARVDGALRAEAMAPGMVEITEKRIGYYGPAGGGFVSLDDLQSIEIRTTADGPAAEDLYWLLIPPPGEETLIIPNGARGADRLLTAFQGLPGFDNEQVIRAMGSTDAARFVIWRRPASPANALQFGH